MKDLYILTGKIKSGKTNELFRWIIDKKNVGGILQPVVDGKRFIYSISQKRLIQLEISSTNLAGIKEEDLIKIGNYLFLNNAFDKARELLQKDFESNFDWLIIDEIGSLELNGSGLEPMVSNILKNSGSFKGSIILVVRESLIDAVIKKFELEGKWKNFDELKSAFNS